MFVNPQNFMEGNIFKLVNERYPLDAQNIGAQFIDGVVFSVKDYEEISKTMAQRGLYEYTENRVSKIYEKIRAIDPCLHFLFQGTLKDKTEMLDTRLFSAPLEKALDEMSSIAKPSEKTAYAIDKIYPFFDTLLVRNLIEFQIKNQMDLIISPSVPVTTATRSKLEKQASKVSEMNRASRVLLDTVFKRAKENTELMSILTVNVSVINPEHMDLLIESIAASEPDHIGIRLLNFHEADSPRIKMILQFIQKIAKRTMGKIPIHVFNVTEFGYVTFCHGATSIVTPIATDPYFKRRVDETPPPRKGAYYHPVDMTHDPYSVLLDKTRPMGYRLPCHCGICKEYENILSVPEEFWNEFRRIHFLLVKSMEIKELRESEGSIKTALKDKFARSQRTAWLSFLD